MINKMDISDKVKTISMFWYSQTGNSLLCCKEAGKFLEQNNFKINICHVSTAKPEDFKADLYIFAFPVYDWNLPYPVSLFLKKFPLQEQSKKALTIITYGSAQANTGYILKKHLALLNIDLVDCKYIIGQDSFIFLKKYWALFDRINKPDAESFQSIKDFLNKNINNNFAKSIIWFNPFNLFHWYGALPHKLHHAANRYLLGKRIFEKEECINCKICVKLCPTQAITLDGKSLNYNKQKCIGCCGCINVCPALAWKSSWFSPEYHFKGNRSASILKAIKNSTSRN